MRINRLRSAVHGRIAETYYEEHQLELETLHMRYTCINLRQTRVNRLGKFATCLLGAVAVGLGRPR